MVMIDCGWHITEYVQFFAFSSLEKHEFCLLNAYFWKLIKLILVNTMNHIELNALIANNLKLNSGQKWGDMLSGTGQDRP